MGATGKSSDSLMLMFQAWQPHESPLWAHVASLPLAAPPSILLPPLLLSTCLYIYITYIHTCITEWSQFLEQVGEFDFFSFALWQGEVAFGMGVGRSARQMPLAQTSWGPRLY